MRPLAFALISALLAPSHALFPNVPKVFLDLAVVYGRRDNGVDQYMGIKFADASRFKLPVPVTKYIGIINATSNGASCPQQKFSATPDVPLFPIPELISEDCLNLNVFVPQGTKRTAKLPVVVYINGGAFQTGSAEYYNATGVTRLLRSVKLGMPTIHVAMNYRVSAWGFLTGKEVEAEGAANFGLYDQRAAIQWVNKYISAFGGDPSRVTLNGESAGSISVTFQMLAFGGNYQNLFQGVFSQSGAILPSPTMEFPKGQALFDFLAAQTGCGNALNKLACLRTVPLSVLTDAVDKTPDIFSYSGGAVSWIPTIDGKFIPESPYQLVLDGKFAPVPLVTGVMDDEGTMFSLQQTNLTTDEDFRTWIRTYWFPDATAAELEPLWTAYPPNPADGSPFDTGDANQLYPQFKRVSAFQGDALFQAPRRYLTQNLPRQFKTWVYQSKRSKDTQFLGSFHGSDLFLGFLDDYLINFAYNGNPNVNGTVFWPQYTRDNQTMYTFRDGGDNYLAQDDYRKDSMANLTSIFMKYPL